MEPVVPSQQPVVRLSEPFWSRVRHAVLGPPRDLHDPHLGRKVSLIAFLAWVGLGADGLSSSAYGPEEAFRSLGEHSYLAVGLALATAATVFIISYAYSRIIEHFPLGGGGYLVASALLGRTAGVVSGCALLVDYVFTITVSVAAGGDAVFSLLPMEYHAWKLPLVYAVIGGLAVMNLRGAKESVTALIPIFLCFVATHALLIVGGILVHAGDVPALVVSTRDGFRGGLAALGGWGLLLLFFRAYAYGAGTYTGIEAVSNGLAIMRDPKVETGKRTMRYMAASLAFTAAGLLVCYMLVGVRPREGMTLNAVLADSLAGGVEVAGLPVGRWFVTAVLASEAVLLLIAAQAGFIDGPRVMANMATDGWIPRRFAALSDRMTQQNGILLMGAAAVAILAYTAGDVRTLVVMYSINVFLTFSLSETGMIRFWLRRPRDPGRAKNLAVHGTGLVICASMLAVMVAEKFGAGGWVTVLLTGACVASCFAIRRHYRGVSHRVRAVERALEGVPEARAEAAVPAFDPLAPTAAILVGGFGRMGVHVLLNIFRLFPRHFRNVVFLSVGVIDSKFFAEGGGIERFEAKTREGLERYVEYARRIGLPARYAFKVGTDVIDEAADLCLEAARENPRAVFFAGELIFEEPRWWHRVLHNETAYAIQRRIRHAGLSMMVVPLVLRPAEERGEAA